METGGEDGGKGSDVRGGDEGETLKNFKMKKKIRSSENGAPDSSKSPCGLGTVAHVFNPRTQRQVDLLSSRVSWST